MARSGCSFKAGFEARFAPIYTNALIGMVTFVGQWWPSEQKKFKKEEVAAHISAIAWMGLRHLPKDPSPVHAPLSEPKQGEGEKREGEKKRATHRAVELAKKAANLSTKQK
ncbi:MAG: hypothetical protein GY822_12610 [Deltaproteobacteria bacterium]|nr:hypothetical protein [Deltaproteobacteria bacterium]